MADPKDSSLQFFQKASPSQWAYVLKYYKEVMKIHAHKTRGFKKNGPEELLKLDSWFQETLPKNIHARKDIHVTRDELIQVTKWKLIRGKARSRLLDLVRLNTDLAVKQATQKAFKKLPNISSAITALTNLKGVGLQTASAVLCAGYPEHCPYMADEAMLATPGVEASDYTHTEFVNFATQITSAADRLNTADPDGKWTPHSVELTLWVHYLSKDYKPSILKNLPLPDGSARPKDEEDEDEDDDEDKVTSSEDHLEEEHSSGDSKNGMEDSVAVAASGTNGNGRHTSSLDEDSNMSGGRGSDNEVVSNESSNSNLEADDSLPKNGMLMSTTNSDQNLVLHNHSSSTPQDLKSSIVEPVVCSSSLVNHNSNSSFSNNSNSNEAVNLTVEGGVEVRQQVPIQN